MQELRANRRTLHACFGLAQWKIGCQRCADCAQPFIDLLDLGQSCAPCVVNK